MFPYTSQPTENQFQKNLWKKKSLQKTTPDANNSRKRRWFWKIAATAL